MTWSHFIVQGDKGAEFGDHWFTQRHRAAGADTSSAIVSVDVLMHQWLVKIHPTSVSRKSEMEGIKSQFGLDRPFVLCSFFPCVLAMTLTRTIDSVTHTRECCLEVFPQGAAPSTCGFNQSMNPASIFMPTPTSPYFLSYFNHLTEVHWFIV